MQAGQVLRNLVTFDTPTGLRLGMPQEIAPLTLVPVFGDATFDGPARAVRCAQALARRTPTLGLDVRSGVHTGEIELIGDDVGGIAVHISSRVIGHAGAGEVVCSSTVKDLVAGSDIEFEDRGVHPLKGVLGEWRLYAARN